MGKTGFYYDETCFWHVAGSYAGPLPIGGWVQPPSGANHAESPETKRRLKNLMDRSGLTQKLMVSGANPAKYEDLQRIHPESYLQKFKELSNLNGGELGPNASIGNGSYEIACVSSGLVCQAVEDVVLGNVKNAYALCRPPGHHCLPDQAMGFCFLANIPIAIERVKAKHNVGRVAVIDWDVHHGNGTQSIYLDRDDVLSISIHQENCFPPGYSGASDRGVGKGEGYNINIPLLPGSGHDAYVYAFEKIVLPALESYKPDLIIVACGYDANAVDPLARMLAHSNTFRMMTTMLKNASEQLCGGRLVLAHEGGYAESYVPFCGLATMEALSGHKTEVEDPLLEFINLQQPSADFVAFQQSKIDQLKQTDL